MNPIKTFLYTASLLLFIQSCTTKPEPSPAPAATQAAAADSLITLSDTQLSRLKPQTAIITKSPLDKIIETFGKIVVPPNQLVNISFPMGGYIKSFNLVPGAYVEKGAVLAVLEDPSFINLQQEYLTTKIKLDYLSQDFKRQQELRAGDAISAKSFQQADMEYKTQQINLKALAEKLVLIGINPASLSAQNIQKDIAVRSNINGYITKINVQVGSYVSPTLPLFELINHQQLMAEMTVFEEYINDFKVGMMGKINLSTNPSASPANVRISSITQNLSNDKTSQIYCSLLNPIEKFRPGISVKGIFLLKTYNVTTIPLESLVRFEGKNYVFINDTDRPNQFILTPVTTGLINQGKVEILFPKNLDGKRVVTQNANKLLGSLKNKMED